jgi:hypothetical protein
MIQFTYRLTGNGWARATIADEWEDMSVPASYLCDALNDFVYAVLSLFVSAKSECTWEEEPGQVVWKFDRSGKRLSVDLRWKDGQESFTGKDDFLHFCSEVGRELDGLLATWTAEGYRKQWRHPFPLEGHRKLKEAVKSEQQSAVGNTQL